MSPCSIAFCLQWILPYLIFHRHRPTIRKVVPLWTMIKWNDSQSLHCMDVCFFVYFEELRSHVSHWLHFSNAQPSRTKLIKVDMETHGLASLNNLRSRIIIPNTWFPILFQSPRECGLLLSYKLMFFVFVLFFWSGDADY